ncbi:MAG: hypothetical protein FWD11_00330, partial [Micrococcales bacterium]|nr:hypothetical protein [Micrococcales bacterium]
MATSSPYEFVFPQRLVKDVLPRPGGVEVPQPPFAKDAADRWWARLDAVRDKVNELLASEKTDPLIADAAKDESSPAWAAMALHIKADRDERTHMDWRWTSDCAQQSWADPAVVAIGPVAAAQVAVWWAATGVLVKRQTRLPGARLSGWQVAAHLVPDAALDDGHQVLCSTAPDRLRGFVCRGQLPDYSYQHVDDPSVRVHDVRLRLRLAASGWDGVAEALEPLSILGQAARLVMSALVPQRRDWYSAADPRCFPDLLLSASTLDELLAGLERKWRWDHLHPAVPTLLDALGVDLAELVEVAFTLRKVDQETLPVNVLAAIPTQTAFQMLLKAADVNREAATAVVGHAVRWPRVAAPLLAASAATNPRSRTLLGMLSVDDLAEHRADFSAEEWAVIEAHAKVPDGPVAEESAVPGLFMALPWDRRPTVPVLKLTTPASAGSEAHWLPGEREEWLTWPTGLPSYLAPVSEAEAADLKAPRYNAEYAPDGAWAIFLAQAPLEVTAPRIGHVQEYYPQVAALAHLILARQEDVELAAQTTLGFLMSGAPGEMPFVNQAIVTKMVQQTFGKKMNLRLNARTYLQRHAEYASGFLVPVAFGKRGKAQQAALSVLLMLHDVGHGDAVVTAAATFGDAAVRAWETVVSAGPVVLGLPAKPPALPGWLADTALPQVQLTSGAGALPATAVKNLVTMLAISTMDTPYAGLDVVRDSCTAESLATFVWGLFEQWQVAGHPAADGWVLDALGLFGNDQTARRLAPLVR